ncbi:MAG: hypothetical protein LBI10_11185 [Deltaproteobacteria bacterium]|jgi:hypothetical protein|nr:hypothetical protein [Deltaproteobacteria bacterium]
MTVKLEFSETFKSPKPLAWVLGAIFLFGLSFGLISLACYSRLAALWPPGPLGGVVFFDLAGLALAMGGLWWGDSIKGESLAATPLLALTLIVGSIFFLIAPLIPPGSTTVRIIDPNFRGYFGDRIGLGLLTLLPGFFLWGSAPPFLASLAFPKEKGLARGVFSIFSLSLVAMALGGLVLGFRPQSAPIWLERLIGLAGLPILIVGLWLWGKTPAENRRDLPLWPSSSLGVWTGDRGYGLDILVSPKRAKTLIPALFLGALASATALTVWLIPALTEGQAPTLALAPIPLILVALAGGSLILGSILANVASPMVALGLDLLLLTLLLAYGPRPPAGEMATYLVLGGILATLGALWPLAARVSLVRYDFIPSGLGHVNVWFLGGILVGLTITASFLIQYPVLAAFFYRAALISSFLALAVSFNWLWGLIAVLALGVWRLFFWS